MTPATDRGSVDALPFDVESCRATLTRACKMRGLRSADAELIRLGENAIFHLKSEGLVARIARGLDVLDDAGKEIRVARWLASEGIQTAAPAVAEPIVVDERPVTFWEFVEHTGEEATMVELGSVLRSLHSLQPPLSLRLPEHDIFGRVDARIGRASGIADSDREFLTARLHDLRFRYSELTFPLHLSAVHGDAHTGNLLRLRSGSTSLIDLERFAYGHPESDLVVTAIEVRVGWISPEKYAAFANAYGFDVMTWDGFDVIQAISELKMTTWLMQNVGHSAAIDAEIRTRISDLRDWDRPRHWSPF